MRIRIALAGWFLAALAILPSGRASAQDFIDQEYQLKAAYLYNFGQYVTWPSGGAIDGTDGAFVIGVLGADPFGDNLARVAAAKTVLKKRIVVKQFDSAKDIAACHILFVSATAADGSAERTSAERVQAAAAKVAGSPTLVVGNVKGSAQLGGHIAFTVESNKLFLEINPDAAKRAGVTISSQLLRLAVVRIVKDK